MTIVVVVIVRNKKLDATTHTTQRSEKESFWKRESALMNGEESL